jgi:hypothetical protein
METAEYPNFHLVSMRSMRSAYDLFPANDVRQKRALIERKWWRKDKI